MFDKQQMVFETLGSKIAKGSLKVIPADFERNLNCSEGTQCMNQMSNVHRHKNHVSDLLVFHHQHHSGAFTRAGRFSSAGTLCAHRVLLYEGKKSCSLDLYHNQRLSHRNPQPVFRAYALCLASTIRIGNSWIQRSPKES